MPELETVRQEFEVTRGPLVAEEELEFAETAR
jgi:hypothetical protein